MRRKQGALVLLEVSILEVANNLNKNGIKYFYGFQIIDALKVQKSLLSNGTLYRALIRLEKFGYLTSHWEDTTDLVGNRPRRRYYQLVENKQ